MIFRIVLVFFLSLSLGFIDNAWAGAHKVNVQKPQRLKSYQQLRKLLKEHQMGSSGVMDQFRTQPEAGPATAGVATTGDGGSGGQNATPDFSGTNVQVEGVDEGDSVKTDGAYVYQIARNEVRIIKADPPGDLSLVHTLSLPNEFQAGELYVGHDRLVVLGQTWASTVKATGRWMMSNDKTEVRIYDLSDHANPRLERQVTQDGGYLSSRRIGNQLYVVSRTYPRYYWLDTTPARLSMVASTGRKTGGRSTPANLLPSVSDSAVRNGQASPVRLRDTYYLPEFVEPNYVVVSGLKLDEPNVPVDTQSYLGAGELVYASAQHLYLSASNYPPVLVDANGQPTNDPVPSTQIFKFALGDGEVQFTASGQVPGTVLNQFSMDEHEDYFRVATTVQQWDSNTGQASSYSNLYTLDGGMRISGRLEKLALGEQIYAARFLDERCYLVTFRTVDPLFVIGLNDPTHPTVLGELKIPGYSNYLHPYDDTHIIGFGKATTDEIDTDWGSSVVLNKGMRLALFDVTDVKKPVPMHSVEIGDRGTDSELLYNHKAFWFDRERNLLGFPIQVAKIQDASTDPWAYGEMVFQGAYVYELTLESGFKRQAAITHLDGGAANWEQWPYFINRLLHIGDHLYTLSEGRVKVHGIPGFDESAKLELPVESPTPCCEVLPVEVRGGVGATVESAPAL